MAGYKAFQEKYFNSDQVNLDDFGDVNARKLRYSLLWAMYENTAFDEVHTWGTSYKTKKGLYKYIRNIYNPSYRIGEFWKAKLLGGPLDPAAGDGSEVHTCLPIMTEFDDLRPAIAKIWDWSNWQIKKDVFGLWTPVLGDGVLKIIDDPLREKVYIKPVHPSRLQDVTLDDYGYVKGYVLEYQIPDPRPGASGNVVYREVCERDDTDEIYFSTYLNEGLYAYESNPKEGDKPVAQWSEMYGFVPMVVLQHNDVGLDFGFSEIYPALSKFREADDMASKLGDHVRKALENPMLLAGVADPKTVKKATGQTPTDEKPQPGRTEQKFLYSSSPDAKAHSLVGNLDVAAVSGSIKELLSEIERDYPELRVDIANASGDISGRALRINRSPAVSKVLQRRPNYDKALVRAQQMALSIAGWRKYDGFSGIDLDTFSSGGLEHSIGERPVFENDPMDDLEEEKLFWENAKIAKETGVPLLVYLKQQGWNDDALNEITNSEEYQTRLETSRAALNGLRSANNPEGLGNSASRR